MPNQCQGDDHHYTLPLATMKTIIAHPNVIPPTQSETVLITTVLCSKCGHVLDTGLKLEK